MSKETNMETNVMTDVVDWIFKPPYCEPYYREYKLYIDPTNGDYWELNKILEYPLKNSDVYVKIPVRVYKFNNDNATTTEISELLADKLEWWINFLGFRDEEELFSLLTEEQKLEYLFEIRE
jgi:hypothetical protein